MPPTWLLSEPSDPPDLLAASRLTDGPQGAVDAAAASGTTGPILSLCPEHSWA
jgi:hypothetical protein